MKWIKDLKMRFEGDKIPRKNHSEKLPDLDLGKDFLDMTPKTQVTKAKINK